MSENCSKCGTPLRETTYGRWYCPNCGIDNSEFKSDEENPGYVG